MKISWKWFLVVISILSFSSLFAQKSKEYELSVYSNSLTISHEGFLTQLKDSSILVGTSYSRINGVLVFQQPFTEVHFSDIELIKIRKIRKGGFITGAVTGLIVGGVAGGLSYRKPDCRPSSWWGCPTSFRTDATLASSALGFLVGGVIGSIIHQNTQATPFFEINKNHKKYMNNKEYLEKYVFKY